MVTKLHVMTSEKTVDRYFVALFPDSVPIQERALNCGFRLLHYSLLKSLKGKLFVLYRQWKDNVMAEVGQFRIMQAKMRAIKAGFAFRKLEAVCHQMLNNGVAVHIERWWQAGTSEGQGRPKERKHNTRDPNDTRMPDLRKVKKIVQKVDENGDGIIQPSEIKELFVRLLGISRRYITDTHPSVVAFGKLTPQEMIDKLYGASSREEVEDYYSCLYVDDQQVLLAGNVPDKLKVKNVVKNLRKCCGTPLPFEKSEIFFARILERDMNDDHVGSADEIRGFGVQSEEQMVDTVCVGCNKKQVARYVEQMDAAMVVQSMYRTGQSKKVVRDMLLQQHHDSAGRLQAGLRGQDVRMNPIHHPLLAREIPDLVKVAEVVQWVLSGDTDESLEKTLRTMLSKLMSIRPADVLNEDLASFRPLNEKQMVDRLCLSCTRHAIEDYHAELFGSRLDDRQKVSRIVHALDKDFDGTIALDEVKLLFTQMLSIDAKNIDTQQLLQFAGLARKDMIERILMVCDSEMIQSYYSGMFPDFSLFSNQGGLRPNEFKVKAIVEVLQSIGTGKVLLRDVQRLFCGLLDLAERWVPRDHDEIIAFAEKSETQMVTYLCKRITKQRVDEHYDQMVKERKRKEATLSHATRRLLKYKMAQGFAKWQSWVRNVKKIRKAAEYVSKHWRMQVVRKAFAKWRVEAAELKRQTARRRQATQKFALPKMNAAFKQWQSWHQTRVAQRSRVREAVLRWRKLKLAQAFRRWHAVAKAEACCGALTLRAFQCFHKPMLAGAWKQWRPWAANTNEEKRMVNQVVSHWTSLKMHSAWSAWRDWAKEAPKREAVVENVIGHWRMLKTGNAFTAWSVATKEMKRQRKAETRVLQHWLHQRLQAGWWFWRDWLLAHREQTRKVRNAVAHWHSSKLAKAFPQWRAIAKEFAHQVELETAILSGFVHRLEYAAWRQWRDWAKETKQQKRRLAHVMRHWRSFKVGGALNKWRETAKEQGRQMKLEHSMRAKFTQQLLYSAWGTWRDAALTLKRMTCQLGTVVDHWRHNEMAMGFNYWRATIREVRRMVRLETNAIRKFRHSLRFSALAKWMDWIRTRRETRQQADHAVRHWRSRSMAAAFEKWHTDTAETNRQVSTQASSVKHFTQLKLSMAWNKWHDVDWASRAKHQKEQAKFERVVLHFRELWLCKAYNTWIQYVEETASQKRKVRKAIKHLRPYKLATAFTKWKTEVEVGLQWEQTARHVVARFMEFKVCLAFEKWASVNRAEKAKTARFKSRLSTRSMSNIKNKWKSRGDKRKDAEEIHVGTDDDATAKEKGVKELSPDEQKLIGMPEGDDEKEARSMKEAVAAQHETAEHTTDRVLAMADYDQHKQLEDKATVLVTPALDEKEAMKTVQHEVAISPEDTMLTTVKTTSTVADHNQHDHEPSAESTAAEKAPEPFLPTTTTESEPNHLASGEVPLTSDVVLQALQEAEAEFEASRLEQAKRWEEAEIERAQLQWKQQEVQRKATAELHGKVHAARRTLQRKQEAAVAQERSWNEQKKHMRAQLDGLLGTLATKQEDMRLREITKLQGLKAEREEIRLGQASGLPVDLGLSRSQHRKKRAIDEQKVHQLEAAATRMEAATERLAAAHIDGDTMEEMRRWAMAEAELSEMEARGDAILEVDTVDKATSVVGMGLTVDQLEDLRDETMRSGSPPPRPSSPPRSPSSSPLVPLSPEAILLKKAQLETELERKRGAEREARAAVDSFRNRSARLTASVSSTGVARAARRNSGPVGSGQSHRRSPPLTDPRQAEDEANIAAHVNQLEEKRRVHAAVMEKADQIAMVKEFAATERALKKDKKDKKDAVKKSEEEDKTAGEEQAMRQRAGELQAQYNKKIDSYEEARGRLSALSGTGAKVCEACGNEFLPDSKYCRNCGTPRRMSPNAVGEDATRKKLEADLKLADKRIEAFRTTRKAEEVARTKAGQEAKSQVDARASRGGEAERRRWAR